MRHAKKRGADAFLFLTGSYLYLDTLNEYHTGFIDTSDDVSRSFSEGASRLSPRDRFYYEAVPGRWESNASLPRPVGGSIVADPHEAETQAVNGPPQQQHKCSTTVVRRPHCPCPQSLARALLNDQSWVHTLAVLPHTAVGGWYSTRVSGPSESWKRCGRHYCCVDRVLRGVCILFTQTRSHYSAPQSKPNLCYSYSSA